MPSVPLSRRRLLAGSVLAAAGAAVGMVRDSTADAYAGAAEEDASAAPAEHPAGRLGVRRLIWSVPNQQNLVGLTFDDGPTPRYTPHVLEILRDAGVSATFNVVGVRALEHRSLLREVVAAGHQLGNHTHHHQDLSQVPPERVRAEIREAQDAVEQCVQAPVRLFRPPRGELTGDAAREAAGAGLDVLMWSLTRDVNGVGTPAAVVASLAHRTTAGDIIALHDGLGHAGFTPRSPMAQLLRRRRDVEMKALPDVLAQLAARDLRCVSIAELLATQDEGGTAGSSRQHARGARPTTHQPPGTA